MADRPLLVEYVPKNFSPARERVIGLANEILEDYASQGYDLTLRQLYYQFVARALIANSDREYKNLGSLVNDARLAGRIGWNRITDRTRNLRGIYHVNDVEQAISETSEQFALDLWKTQDYRVEVWVEKDALIGVVQQAADRLDVPYFSCRGYTSQSELWGAAMRVQRYLRDGKKVLIVHLGDHDPSGIDMTRDIRDRLEMFASRHVQNVYDLTVNRIALNMDQVEQYNPPPNPAKLTDSRGAGYVIEHGDESWELDALEPRVLEQLIQDAVFAVRDIDEWEDAERKQERERQRLEAVSDRWDEVVGLLEGDE